jgi:hypothetical protein
VEAVQSVFTGCNTDGQVAGETAVGNMSMFALVLNSDMEFNDAI